MLSELNIFWLLLPLAALSGWWIGRSNQEQKLPLKDIYPEYFKGLNFVLNEQPDKAIEVFIRMAEVDSETVETHLASASLILVGLLGSRTHSRLHSYRFCSSACIC